MKMFQGIIAGRLACFSTEQSLLTLPAQMTLLFHVAPAQQNFAPNADYRKALDTSSNTTKMFKGLIYNPKCLLFNIFHY